MAGLLSLHASGLVGRRGALLFLGFSGAGKTTISSRVLGSYPRIHDETVIVDLRGSKDRPVAFGSRLLDAARRPATPDRIPIAGLFVLRQSNRCGLRRMNGSRMLPVMGYVPYRVSRAELTEYTNRVFSLLERVPCYELEFNLNSRELQQVLSPFLGPVPRSSVSASRSPSGRKADRRAVSRRP